MRLLLPLLCAIAAMTAEPSNAQGKRFMDSDWTTAFKDSCGLPSRTSVERVRIAGDRKLKFTLVPSYRGKCSTDSRARHRAPYWERAELSQVDRMPLGTRTRITAEVTFLEGFTGDRETFFQIHAWNKNCQKAYPPLMLKFSDGRLKVETLRGVTQTHPGNHRNALRKKVEIGSLYGKSLPLTVEFDSTSQPGKVSVTLGGTPLVQDAAIAFATCATPYVKLGIYRPGEGGGSTSIVLYDDLTVQSLSQ